MEGPSIYLLAQDFQIVKNQKIKKIYGNAKFEKDEFVGQTISDVFSFGKRLFFQLDTHAITIHFLMYGSYRVDEPRKDMPIRLAIETSKNKVYFYNCSIKCIKIAAIKKLLPFQFDIVSDSWNVDTVIKKMKKHATATIDDVLLDQEIFAGVGNIIKNEALFMSKIKPGHTIAKLSAKKLKEVAHNARIFSLHFVEWRREFQFKKHLQIYRKKFCPVCGSLVIRKQTGKRKRWSFYCLECQR